MRDSGAMLVFDAGQGYGQRAAREAVLAAVERAREHGVCVYSLRRASHIGRVGTYAELAAEAGSECSNALTLCHMRAVGLMQTSARSLFAFKFLMQTGGVAADSGLQLLDQRRRPRTPRRPRRRS